MEKNKKKKNKVDRIFSRSAVFFISQEKKKEKRVQNNKELVKIYTGDVFIKTRT